jgi:hypothetical protein
MLHTNLKRRSEVDPSQRGADKLRQTQMNKPQSEPISRHLRDAFYGAVQLYPDWTAFGLGPVVSVDGRRYTISEVCNLAIEIRDELPDDLLGSLMFFLNAGDRDLLEGLAKDRSYAGGARYLINLMNRRAAESATFAESRRNG